MKKQRRNERLLTRRGFMGGAAALAAFAIVPRYVLGGSALPADQSGHVMLRWEEVVGILDDNSLKDRAKLDAIRGLVARPGTEPLSPIRFI